MTVHPTSAGTHSAILNLDDPATTGIDKQTLNTVVAAEQFTAANNYSIAHSGTIGRNQAISYFFNVPAGVPALKVDLVGGGSTPGAGQIRFLRFHPYGIGLEDNSSLSCYNPSSGSCSGSPTSRTQGNPQAGVWEVTVEARRTSDMANAPYTLTTSILGALGLAEPGHHRLGDGRDAGLPQLHADEHVRCLHRPGGRFDLGSALITTPSIVDGRPAAAGR